VETFVVRVWTGDEPNAAQGGGLRGVVEHVSSGGQEPFADAGRLIALLHGLPEGRAKRERVAEFQRRAIR
jgi:hypothetical protein